MTLVYEDGEKSDEVFDMNVWKTSPEEFTFRIAVNKKVEKLYLDESHFFDSNPKNNSYHLKP
jgi:hypothetical protein